MKIYRLFVLMFCLCILLIANELSVGSSYQIQGLGNLNYINQADQMGRGGTAMAIADRNSINSINPAGLIFIDLTRISGNFQHELTSLTSSDATGTSSYSNFHGAQIAIPLAVNKVVVSLGIQPFARNDFQIEAKETLATGNEYLKQKILTGGLNQFTFGMAVGFHKRFSGGVFINYNFGKLEENWKVDFISDEFLDAADKRISILWGANVSAGVMLQIKPNLFLGATYSQPMSLTVHRHLEYSFGELSETIRQKIKIPCSYGIGTSYYPIPRIMLAIDFYHQIWSQYEIDKKRINEYNDRYIIAGGIEILPLRRLLTSAYNRLTYRAGFYYGQSDYLGSKAENISEFMGTIGLGIPFFENYGRVDFSLGYGKRGNLDKNPIAESIFKFMISVNGGEKWFLRQRNK